MRPVIHSVKHYVQISRSTALTGTVVNEDIIKSVEGTVANAVDEVVEGAIVKAVYFELWLIGSVSDQHAIVTITKQPIGVAGPAFGNMVALGTYVNKKNVFFTHQGLAGNDGISLPIPVLRGWIKIPKSKQRFGLGDNLILSIASQGDASIFYCGFATYKEYT